MRVLAGSCTQNSTPFHIFSFFMKTHSVPTSIPFCFTHHSTVCSMPKPTNSGHLIRPHRFSFPAPTSWIFFWMAALSHWGKNCPVFSTNAPATPVIPRKCAHTSVIRWRRYLSLHRISAWNTAVWRPRYRNVHPSTASSAFSRKIFPRSLNSASPVEQAIIKKR